MLGVGLRPPPAPCKMILPRRRPRDGIVVAVFATIEVARGTERKCRPARNGPGWAGPAPAPILRRLVLLSTIPDFVISLLPQVMDIRL